MPKTIIAAIAVFISAWTSVRAAGPLVDQVTLVNDASVANVPLPVDSSGNSAVTFTVAQSGSYTITVTDLGQPAPLAAGSLRVSVATSTASVAQFSSTGSQPATLVANTTYTVQPLATAASGFAGGTLSVSVQGSSQPVWTSSPAPPAPAATHEWVVSAATAVQQGESVLADQFTISTNDTYTLTLSDLAFPAALQSVDLLIVDHATGLPVGNQDTSFGPVVLPSGPGGLQAGGTYDLYVVACATNPCGQAGSGLYGVQIVGASVGSVYAKTAPVGSLPPAQSIPVAANGTVSLALNDVGYPAALASLNAVVAQGGGSLQSIATPGTYSFTAAQGSLQLYVLATPGASGTAAYAAYATENGTTLIDTAQPVLDSVHYGYAFTPFTPASPVSAGPLQLQVNDFNRPSTFTSLAAVAVQAGTLVPSSTVVGTGNASSFSVQTGGLTLLVFPELQSGQNGLFGAVLVSGSSGKTIYNTTQGVGALFTSQNVAVANAGNYTIEATDLGFPTNLSNLYVIITNGQSAVGQLIFSGQTTFTANAAGTYVINVLTQVGSGFHYGQYGIQLAQAVAPTVTLSASPTTVTAGGKTQLTWSSTNATSCQASGGGWSGNLATSGSEQSPAVSATTTFVLTCTGNGGPANAQVQVTVVAAKSSGGGGMDKATLLGLCLLLLWKLASGASVRSRPQARSR